MGGGLQAGLHWWKPRPSGRTQSSSLKSVDFLLSVVGDGEYVAGVVPPLPAIPNGGHHSGVASLHLFCSGFVHFLMLLFIYMAKGTVRFFFGRNGAFKAHTNSSDWAFGLVWASLNSTKTLADAIYTHPLYYTHPSPHFCYANRHKYPPLKNHPILICFISPLSQHRPKLP